MCSFWLADNYILADDPKKARVLFECLIGNFPPRIFPHGLESHRSQTDRPFSRLILTARPF